MPGRSVGPDCPVEYAALQKTPEPWDRADVVYVASLVGGIFGKGGGAEFANARWLQQLEAQFGPDEARRIFDDLALPTTPRRRRRPAPRPYGGGPVDPTLPGVALPDLDGPTAPGTGADAGSGGVPLPGTASLEGRLGEGRPMVVDGPFGPIDLGAVPDGMSNAALMGADRTADGHPAVVFGPQTGYFAPQLLTEQAVVAPGIRARGVSFAGTSLVVQLGRGVDYAWSATSAGSDLVDTVVERLCEPDGGPATVESEGYLDGDELRRDGQRRARGDRDPEPGRPRPSRSTYRFLVLRTEHGIVQLRTTVDGAPVAIVPQRSTYGRELDSALGFERLGNPDYVKDAASFREAAAAIDYTFNWFYVDDRDIAYYSSGRLPLRAEGIDPHLPRWGDAAYDWQGWLATDAHPQQVNPPSGYLVSWNNKQAPGFGAADDQWGYGPVHRSEALSDRMAALAAAGGVTTTDMVAAVQDAATVDSRAVYTLPSLLDVIGDDPDLAEAVALLRGWTERGAHRLDRDRDGAYEEQAAVALFDEWWGPADGTEQGVAQDLLRGTLGDLVARAAAAAGTTTRGRAWAPRGTASPGTATWSRTSTWCAAPTRARGRRPTAAAATWPPARPSSARRCRPRWTACWRSRASTSVGELTYDKHLDDIRSTTAGLVGVRDIDWQNRPTFQQVVTFEGHRPRS